MRVQANLKSRLACICFFFVFFTRVFFFRFSQLSHIKACVVKFFPSYAPIFLESSKTDQFCDGAWIVIARSDLPTCPVKALEAYISAAQIDFSEDLPLFRAHATPRSKGKVRGPGNSYMRARELLKH